MWKCYLTFLEGSQVFLMFCWSFMGMIQKIWSFYLFIILPSAILLCSSNWLIFEIVVLSNALDNILNPNLNYFLNINVLLHLVDLKNNFYHAYFLSIKCQVKWTLKVISTHNFFFFANNLVEVEDLQYCSSGSYLSSNSSCTGLLGQTVQAVLLNHVIVIYSQL